LIIGLVLNLKDHTEMSVLIISKESFYYLMIRFENLINQNISFLCWILSYLFAITKNTYIICRNWTYCYFWNEWI